MKKTKLRVCWLLMIIVSLSMTSCMTIAMEYGRTADPDTIIYEPGINLKGNGTIAISDFIYIHDKGIKENEIKHTAAGWIYFNTNINEYVKGALHKELVYIGYSVEPSSNKIIDGVIENLMINDLGFNVNYYSTIKFNIVVDDKVGYSNTFNSKKKGPKGNSHEDLNSLIRDCIKKFISDAQKQNII